MAKIANNLTELIGGTPLMKLAGYSRKYGLQREVVAKLESFNPAGSVKDRVGLAMIEDAEARGALKPGATIIEPTSGNTGVGLAMVATIKGYHLILTMPETMSIERRNLLKALGAEIVLTDGLAGMAGSIAKAQELRDKIPGAVILQQFENPSNARIHELTTGEEIWTDTDGQVDVFVAGVGTGGTICGVARALKRHNPNVYIVAVEPASSPVLEGGEDAPHRIQGIGANFIPALYDASVVDEVIPVPDDEAFVPDANWHPPRDCWREYLPERLSMRHVCWRCVPNLPTKRWWPCCLIRERGISLRSCLLLTPILWIKCRGRTFVSPGGSGHTDGW